MSNYFYLFTINLVWQYSVLFAFCSRFFECQIPNSQFLLGDFYVNNNLLIMSIYGDDGDIYDILNKNIEDEENSAYKNEENQDGNDDDNNDEKNDEDDSKEKVEPKKRVSRNPRFTLNAKLLKGPRGITTIEKYFENMKFKGKGYEREDLNNILKNLEHWCHRLYPKYSFGDSIAVIEKLGKKKELSTYMGKYRLNLLEPDLPIIDEPENEKLLNNSQDPINQFDEIDELLDKQITLAKHHTTAANTSTNTNNSLFDQLHDENTNSKSNHNTSNHIFEPSQPEEETPVLTSELMAKITANRLAAQQKLKQKNSQSLFELDLSKM